MQNESHDIVIIGGGPAGVAAALGAREAGIDDVLIIERDERLGGILNQCIHNGFGLHTFKEELTGPEYAQRYIDRISDEGILFKLNTSVVDLSAEREVTYINSEEGMVTVKAGAVILAMGCRERPRGALGIPGFRQAGVYTAGTAQRLMNIEGYKVGNEVVVLGSGDIGLIMARRMTLEGARVKVVAELLPYSGGLKRNIVQCLDDYDIPLKLSHTVTKVHGKERVSGVTIAEVGSDRKPVAGTEEYYDCDTLLLSCGLIPENELSKGAGIKMDPVTGGAVVTDSLETSIPGIFSCGNVLHVHDLVDFVSEEAKRAGLKAANYIRQSKRVDLGHLIKVNGVNGVRYTVPQFIDPKLMDQKVTVRFRVGNVYRDKFLSVCSNGVEKRRLKKRIMAPGEMEEVVISRESLDKDTREITIQVVDQNGE